MKAACYYDKDNIKIEEIPIPELSNEDILIKLKACGICGTDSDKIVNKKVKEKTVLGHEVAGDIVKAGKNVKKFKEGDRIVVAHHVPCFTCWYCKHGNYNLCEQFKINNLDPGGFAEYVRIKDRSVEKATFILPDNLSYEEGIFFEPLACCIRAFFNSHFNAGDIVMILGLGPAGLLHIQLAKTLGAKYVLGADIIENRLKKAKEIGADYVFSANDGELIKKVKEKTSGYGVDLVMVAVGSTKAISTSMELAYPGGTVCLFADCKENEKIEINPNLILHREVNIVGSYSSIPSDQNIALDMINKGLINVKTLISNLIPLDEIQKGINLALTKENSYKIIMVP